MSVGPQGAKQQAFVVTFSILIISVVLIRVGSGSGSKTPRTVPRKTYGSERTRIRNTAGNCSTGYSLGTVPSGTLKNMCNLQKFLTIEGISLRVCRFHLTHYNKYFRGLPIPSQHLLQIYHRLANKLLRHFQEDTSTSTGTMPK